MIPGASISASGSRGPRGLAGKDGRPGIDGKDGVDGKNGLNGLDGSEGKGIRWRGGWDKTAYYLEGDVVGYQGSSYICVDSCSGPEPLNKKYWNLLASKGGTGRGGGGSGAAGRDGVDGQDGAAGISFIWRGAWDAAVAYSVNDVVYSSGSSYIAIQAGTAHLVSDTAFWSPLALGGTGGGGGGSGDIDGGSASAAYLPVQELDGGDANG